MFFLYIKSCKDGQIRKVFFEHLRRSTGEGDIDFKIEIGLYPQVKKIS